MLMVASEKSPPNPPSMPGLNRRLGNSSPRLEVRAEEPLFRVNRGAALEADALRFGAAVYQKKDSEHWQSRQEIVC